MPITHEFVSAKTDPTDATLVKPSDWNAPHLSPAWGVTLAGGRTTATPGAAVAELDVALRTRIDFSNVDRVHLVAAVVTPGAIGTTLLLQTSTDQAAWTTLADVPVDQAGVSEGYAALVALGQVYARLSTSGGDGATNLVIGSVRLSEGGEEPPATGPFANDAFAGSAGTDVTAHGTDWSYQAGGTSGLTFMLSDANRLRANGSGTLYRGACHAAVPPSADYDVTALIRVVSDNNQSTIGVAGRMDPAALRCYFARYNTGNNRWEIVRFNADAGTVLGWYGQTYATGEAATVMLRMRGTTISLLVDGVERVSVVDTAISAAGKAGVFATYGVTNTTGLHLDDWQAVAA